MNPPGTRSEGTLTHPNMPSIVGYTNSIGQYTINTNPGKNNTRFLGLITTQSTHPPQTCLALCVTQMLYGQYMINTKTGKITQGS